MENNQKTEALELFRQINSPDEYLYSTIFKLCVELDDPQSLQFGKNLFEKMPKIFHNDKILLNTAMNLFNKCKDISKSEEIFSKMTKDLISYSIMMQGYFEIYFNHCKKISFSSRLSYKWNASKGGGSFSSNQKS
jgi:hypothetical protein